MIDNRATLVVFYGLGGALLVVVAASSAWSGVDRPLTAVLGALALVVSAALGRLRRLPAAPMHALVLAGSAIIAAGVWAAGGGAAGTAVSTFAGWVVVYGALFLSRRQAVVHSAVALGTASLALSVGQPGASAALHVTLLVTTAASTGAVVGVLTRRTRVLGTTDVLTGLLDEAGLSQVVARDLAGVDERRPGLLVLLDIDRFGELNQALGREGGDELLRQVAQAHRRGTEQFGTVARLGGDDFALWLPRVPDLVRGTSPAEIDMDELVRGVAAASGPFEVSGVLVDIDVTVGGVLATHPGDGLKTLLQRADTALHAARGADRAALLWNPQLEERTAEGVQLQAQLRSAVAEGQLRLHYQPLVDAHSRQVRGVEALVRWQHPTRGLLAPGAFLPEAERSSVIVALTDWVLGEALEQAGAWQRAERPLRVSVNLSARLIAHDGLVEQVRAHLERTGVPAHLLVLEVTESAVMAQPQRAAAALAQLRALGVVIALDDFGTGCTSLAMLQDLPLDELKVDRRFVAGAVRGGGDEAIVRSVVELAHRLGLEVVAEGVEEEDTAALLAQAGYDLLQGYHFSRPVPAGQVEHLDFTPPLAEPRALVPELERARARSAEQHAAAAGVDDAVLRELSAIAARVAQAPVAAVTFIGAQEQHVSATVGVTPFTGPSERSFCRHALDVGELLQVPDTTADARFRDLPMVTSGPRVRFYAGVPITDVAGHLLGTVCVFDQRPRTLSADQQQALRALARAASARLASLTAAEAGSNSRSTAPVTLASLG